MKKKSLFSVLALLILTLIVPIGAYATTVNGLYVFGDSLSDNGNLYKIREGKVPISPPYYQGRFSNGPVWVEDLNTLMGFSPPALHDYAVGGAQTRGGWVRSYKRQIAAFVQKNPSVNPQGLYIIWIGANNYFFHPQEKLSAVNENVNDIMSGIRMLTQHGARNFVVVNLPDMGLTPWALKKDQQQGNSNYSQHLHQLVMKHNTLLSQQLQRFKQQNPQATVVEVNAGQWFLDAVKNPKKFGVKYVNSACYPGTFKVKSTTVCSDPQNYLFWDFMHPTQKIHAEFAEIAAQQIATAGISSDQ